MPRKKQNAETPVPAKSEGVIETKIAPSLEEIESIFAENSLGYFDIQASKVQWTGEDIANYAATLVEEGQTVMGSAMRKSILAISAAIESDPGCKDAIKDVLASRWAKQTVAGIMSVAKMLPAFRANGVDLRNVKDVFALREVNKLLKDTEDKRTKKAIVSRLNKGEAPRKVRDAFTESDEEEGGEGAGSSDGDKSAAKETRLAEFLKLAKAVAKDCEEDTFAKAKIVATVAKTFGISFNDNGATEGEETED